jgi:hypothetical protein
VASVPEGVGTPGRSGHDGTMAHPPRGGLAKPDRCRPSSGVYLSVAVRVLPPPLCFNADSAIRRAKE